jgi:DnaJ-class molecular chaperone
MMIRKEDLLVDCPNCGGTGMVGEKASPGRSQTWTQTCPVCHGDKEQLTEQGKILRDFVNTVLHKKTL